MNTTTLRIADNGYEYIVSVPDRIADEVIDGFREKGYDVEVCPS